MKISYKWLQDYIETNLTAEQAAEKLTDTGLEVSKVHQFNSLGSNLQGFVVGEVKALEKHPNADKLKCTKIDVGTAVLDIVCGAPNVAAGQKVVVATEGTVIQPKNGQGFTIKKSKLRGEPSEGMLCSEVEIGVGEDNSGILVLEASAQVGAKIEEHFKAYTDQVIEIDLTPNRTDAMCHYGVARDLRASLYNESVALKLPELKELTFEAGNHIAVEVQDNEACPRYMGVTLENVQVKESPDWLKNRLLAVGLRPINNVVDVTNYVMHELGHPLHAFDADQIKGEKIVVRKAQKGEKIKTLDEVVRDLTEQDLLICDKDDAMCLAGVFGGIDSGVSAKTKRIFLECAAFEPVHVRKTAKSQGLHTDASFRFERGVDVGNTKQVLTRAVNVLQELTGAKLVGSLIDEYAEAQELKQVGFDLANYSRIMGHKIEQPVLEKIFQVLELKVLEQKEHLYTLQVPAYRVDVTREIDVIEEVARIYGYNNIALPSTQSVSFASQSKEDYQQALKQRIAYFLSANACKEIMTNSLVSKELLAKHNYDQDLVEMQNPLSSELDVLRPTLLFSHLDALTRNLNHNNKALRFFECGKTYHLSDAYKEKNCLQISLASEEIEHWNNTYQSGFYALKALVDGLLEHLGFAVSNFKIKEVAKDFEYGISYVKKKLTLLQMGAINSAFTKTMDVKSTVFMCQLDFDLLFELIQQQKTRFSPINKFPTVKRDLALLINKQITFAQLQAKAFEMSPKYLKQVDLFDVYQGKGIANDQKSYALRLTFEDAKQTFTDEQINAEVDKVLKAYTQSFKASLR